MTTALLVIAGIAGLACPLHMWWRMRRGKQPVCAPAVRDTDGVDVVRRRQQELASRVAELSRDEAAAPPAARG